MCYPQATHQAGPQDRWEYEGKARSVADGRLWTQRETRQSHPGYLQAGERGEDQPRQKLRSANGFPPALPLQAHSTLFSQKHGGDVPTTPPAPAWKSSCASQHMNCWVLWPPDLEISSTMYYQMLARSNSLEALTLSSPSTVLWE